jgi:uncharacterized RmlC-like cupin family protein
VDRIRVVERQGLESGPQTAGMTRQTALSGENVWVGEVHTSPLALSGWHHHGEHTTYGYVIAGRLHFDFGPGGRESVEAGPGEFFVVPPHFVHREGNPTENEQVLVGVRVGSGPTVINSDGPEPG